MAQETEHDPMMPYEPVLDVMRRTIKNLEFIERHAAQGGPYEVTQPINSFLGALAHPWEQLSIDVGSISTAEAQMEGWPIPGKDRSSDTEMASLAELIRFMRNGAAHGNITLLPDGRGEIAALRIENKHRKRRTGGIIITVADMRAFLRRFVAEVEKIADAQGQPARIA